VKVSAWLAIVVGVLYGGAVYLMLRRSLFKLIIGLALLSHAANLLIFTSGGLSRARPPVLEDEQLRNAAGLADPLPQALVLTAIVIGFGVLSFALVLFHRTHQAVGSDDADCLAELER
jgi:multicomponent Na+:H+ antiporter subunit C